jgi:hypothetical protein
MIAPARKSTEMPVMALIDSDSYRVGAYFEETKIPHIRPGAGPWGRIRRDRRDRC